MKTWYATNAGNDHQGLVIEEETGRNVAVAYDKADAPLLAAAPAFLAALELIASSDGFSGGSSLREVQGIARATLAAAKGEA